MSQNAQLKASDFLYNEKIDFDGTNIQILSQNKLLQTTLKNKLLNITFKGLDHAHIQIAKPGNASYSPFHLMDFKLHQAKEKLHTYAHYDPVHPTKVLVVVTFRDMLEKRSTPWQVSIKGQSFPERYGSRTRRR